MTSLEARSILRTRSPSCSDPSDALFIEALQTAANDPELARWWAQEQASDQAIAAKLQNTSVPANLKARLLATREPVVVQQPIWARRFVFAAAAILICALLFSFWRKSFQPPPSVADYRAEMVSFIKVAPSLELESHRLPLVLDWLTRSSGPLQINVPQRLQQLQPLGCRTLTFRRHAVALICFQRERDQFVHLFVVDRIAFPHLSERSTPEFAAEGEWMTVSWTEDGQLYFMTTKGDRRLLEKYLPAA